MGNKETNHSLCHKQEHVSQTSGNMGYDIEVKVNGLPQNVFLTAKQIQLNHRLVVRLLKTH
jgi:hypothetical protein